MRMAWSVAVSIFLASAGARSIRIMKLRRFGAASEMNNEDLGALSRIAQ
jgi:hypothetical protein